MPCQSCDTIPNHGSYRHITDFTCSIQILPNRDAVKYTRMTVHSPWGITGGFETIPTTWEPA